MATFDTAVAGDLSKAAEVLRLFSLNDFGMAKAPEENTPSNGSTACSQSPACSFVSQGTVAWPGCGAPANEEKRLAATLQLQLIGKEPNAGLQRYVELVAAVFKRDTIVLSLFGAYHSHNVNCS
ncbi:hypothetical protein WJX82_002201 [Trebouxia sp. C0006]